MSDPSIRTTRIGARLRRIIRINPAVVEYADESGAVHALDLASCARSAGSRVVGLRGALDEPPWFESLGPQPIRLTFESDAAMYRELLVPLGRAGWSTLDGC